LTNGYKRPPTTRPPNQPSKIKFPTKIQKKAVNRLKLRRFYIIRINKRYYKKIASAVANAPPSLSGINLSIAENGKRTKTPQGK
jgi:hypothetical protein